MPSGSAVQMAVRRPTHGPAEPWADDMSPKREVIDLDEHDHQPTESSHTTPDDHLIARRKMNVRLIAAFVIGGVAAATCETPGKSETGTPRFHWWHSLQPAVAGVRTPRASSKWTGNLQ
ncbi:hypothetical protein GCM10027290_31040 [Micromonospora sonneratiae]